MGDQVELTLKKLKSHTKKISNINIIFIDDLSKEEYIAIIIDFKNIIQNENKSIIVKN